MRLSIAYASAESLPPWPLNLSILWIIALTSDEGHGFTRAIKGHMRECGFSR
jgi:hypothetical protein